METKIFVSEIKANTEESSDTVGIFEGYANTFDNLDLVDDIVHKGSFKKTLKESKKRGLFFMHNTRDIANLLGEAVDLKEDDTGLKMKGRIDLETENGKRAFRMVKSGVIDRMSIGFNIIKADYEEIKGKFIRHIKEMKLFEISLIPLGMAANEEALITNVKSIEDLYSIIKDKSNDEEFVKKMFSLLNKKPEELITLIKSINPDTSSGEPETISEDEHFSNLQNILNGGN